MEEFDQDKVDDTTLALLWLTMHRDEFGVRAWKSFDWDTMDRLHSKGFIGDPKGKAKSVTVTEEGQERAKHLFQQMFGPSQEGK
jgi:hypothetical protein